MPEIRIKDIEEHDIDTILAEDIDFEGHLTFKKPLMIKGKFKGEIKSSSSLYVGEKAYVEARIESGIVSSKGRIKGDVVAHSRVEFFSTANVEGDVTTPDLIIESGCKLNGYCNMGGVARTAAPQNAQKTPAPFMGQQPARPEQKPAQGQEPAPQQKPAAPPSAPSGANSQGGAR